jgi:uncharacterized protein YbjQ (UPF0145 family)
MRALLLILCLAVLGVLPDPALARDTQLMLSIQEAMSTADAREKLGGDVRFYFADQAHPTVRERLGQGISNKKTNALNKSDKRACEWVFLSAMVSLQARARELGADAVINIQSYYRKVPVKSATQYECHAGAVIAGVALRGEFVTLAK